MSEATMVPSRSCCCILPQQQPTTDPESKVESKRRHLNECPLDPESTACSSRNTPRRRPAISSLLDPSRPTFVAPRLVGPLIGQGGMAGLGLARSGLAPCSLTLILQPPQGRRTNKQGTRSTSPPRII